MRAPAITVSKKANEFYSTFGLENISFLLFGCNNVLLSFIWFSCWCSSLDNIDDSLGAGGCHALKIE